MPNHQKAQAKTVPPATQKLIKQTQAAAAFFRPMLPEWVIVALSSVFCLFTFVYYDITCITQWSLDLFDLFAEGLPLRDFYAFTAIDTPDHCAYDMFTIVPHAIWNLPIWIAHRFGGVDVIASGLCMGWSKLFFYLCFVATIWICVKISLLLDPDRKKAGLVAFVAASSLSVYTAIFYWGQNDALWILLSMAAVYHCIKGNQRLFIIFAGCSLAMKPFFMFAFLLLLLLTEKRLLHVLLKFVAAAAFMLPCKLIFAGDPSYETFTSIASWPSNRAFAEIFGLHQYTGFWDVSPYIVGFLFLCVWAYWKTIPEADEAVADAGDPAPPKSHKRLNHPAAKASATTASIPRERILWVLYFCFLAYANYLLWIHVDYYRSLSMVPLLAILIIHNKHTTKLTLLLETVMWFVYTLHISIYYKGEAAFGHRWCAWRTDDMLGLARIFGERQTRYANLGMVFDKIFLQDNPTAGQITLVFNALPGVFVVCLAGLMIFCNPGIRPAAGRVDLATVPRWGMSLRLASPLFFVLSAIVLYCWK